ncbi:hypothetical protein BWI93_16705 [Siphonobacter sp. BAB-5385]|uniref:hypothetical protein n=1 Tax=unclassified Siphonobacter TaxID=2635712 RepID=UPI000B9E5BC8|nr:MULTISPECIES: hypothetical protein [unclassified Siphonobacter]OZI07030.1 hypothetical protein BWI93_16705 [Siphonobacter sp. BAB-5385]PMD87515.1 hypothetical protein BWI97_25715 [Siphonobacter sp. BAB-5405]
MAIAKKPSVAKSNVESAMDEKKIEALINKGGSSTKVKPEVIDQPDEDAIKTVLLRLYQSQLTEIEEVLAKIPKRQRPSRHAYIIQALEEKIQRDSKKK